MKTSIKAGKAFLVILGLAAAAQALAQQKSPIATTSEGQTSKYTQQYLIDVGDVPGHQIRIQETHRTYNEKSTFAISGVKVKESWVRGFSDYVGGKGRSWGYGHWVLDDSEKVYFEYNGTTSSEPTSAGWLKGRYDGTTRIVGGTGKYKAIRGTTVDAVSFENDPKTGYNQSGSNGEYWFEE
jgi:hypothetical protein